LNLLLISDSSVLTPIWLSIKTAVTATAITFCLGVGAGFWIANYQGKAKNIIDGILTMPLVLPPTVVGFLLLLALGKNGLIGNFLELLGIRVIFTWYATVIAATVVAFPLMYKTALVAFQQSQSNNLIACARTLGASETTIFWRIILPLAKPGLIAGTLLSFARALGEFGATLILAGSIPGETQTIPIAIFFAAESGAMDRALGLVIILLSISLSAIAGVNYWQHRNRPNIQVNRRINYKINYKKLFIPKTERINQEPASRLQVNIQKQLPEFLLDIAFSIDLEQHPLGILGASGAGKSTLLRCIVGLETPDRGRIVLGNKILFDSAARINLSPQKRRVGLVFQNYALFPHLTVTENIAFGMSPEQSTQVAQTEITQRLQQLNLLGTEHCLPHQLSGGEQQRVALARVMASKPELTLLDEPFSALDTNLKTKLTPLFQELFAEYSGLSLYVTHNLKEAYQFCPQLLLIDRGKVIAWDTRQNIINHPPNIQTAQTTGCRNFSTVQKIAPQVVKALDWQCNLQLKQPIADSINQIGIHNRAVIVVNTKPETNTFPVWLTKHIEFPSNVTLYLKLHSSPSDRQDYHLVAEVTLAKWRKLQDRALPWYVQLPAERIMVFD